MTCVECTGQTRRSVKLSERLTGRAQVLAAGRAAFCFGLVLMLSGAMSAQTLSIEIASEDPIVVTTPTTSFAGTTTAPPGSKIVVSIDGRQSEGVVDPMGAWRVSWPHELMTGSYEVVVNVTTADGRTATASRDLRVDLQGDLPRRPLLPPPAAETLPPIVPNLDDFQATTDRWRIVPPAYELDEKSRGWWDPYNQNVLKGDFPIIGQNIFLSLTGISDTLVEGRSVPTPSGPSAERAGAIEFFGEGDQGFFNQNIIVSADLFEGQTVFRPATWRARATIALNFNHLEVRERGAVNPDVRRGTDRSDGQIGLQELFYERKLADLSPNFDFVSVRAGVQNFSSDFRGFIFNDNNLGVRLFGNYSNNRLQYNVAFFDRLEKDTNSGLNIGYERRDQQVGIANIYIQDFFAFGYTNSFSYHYLKDNKSLYYDQNDFLVRPDPIGDFTPHEISAHYLGWAGFGKVKRANLDHAMYYVFGNDSHNPIAGADPIGGPVGPDGVARGRESVDISGLMAALEVSIDKDWWRPRVAVFYTSGDDDVFDRDAEGFDAIFPNPNFAGGGFSFWNRLGIRLAGTGVGLVQRGSLIPDLNSSKDEGQPNFVNPGVQLISTGIDVELTQKTKIIATANYLRFDKTEVLEGVLFQDDISNEIGLDISIGARYRPFLNNNVIVLVGVAGFVPGSGFEDIYEDDEPLYQLFTNLVLTF